VDQSIFDKFVEAARPFAEQPRPRTAKPVISVNGGVSLDETFERPGWIMFASYLYAVTSSGGIPVVPMVEASTDDYAAVTDGLIMTGSASWVPRPQLKAKAMVESENLRTSLDRSLFHSFERVAKPIFGICLGMQRINQHTGGCFSRQFKTRIGVEHMLSEHMCHAEEGSLLHKVFGSDFLVNSRHNCRVEEIGHGMKVTARAPDGTIEATEHETLPIYGFQFHPERSRGDMPDPPGAPDSTPLFRELMRMALEHR
jgi:putative glutamine amidotransferase